jgi:hypothetical protein
MRNIRKHTKALNTMQRNFMEKRRKRPSFLIPVVFFSLELILMYLVMSLINWDLNAYQWHIYTYPFVVIWLIYSSLKLYFVLKRQNIRLD